MPDSILSRAKALGAASAIALVGPTMMTNFLLAAEGMDPSDVKILNVAIALERAGIKAYTDAAGTGLLTPGVLAVAKGFMSDHIAHRDALIAAVKAGGGTPTDDTTQLTYPPLKTEDDILEFAYSVERDAASTYLSVLPAFKNRDLAKTAGAILGVETTHVAILAYVLKKGTEPYPSSFVSA
jgi:ABC-type nitrate/sulfonate/bicarbonate transport system substrate-binding protein